MPAELLTVKQAAQITGRDSQTIRRWIYAGFLKAQKGQGKYGRFRIYRTDLMEAVKYNPKKLDKADLEDRLTANV